MSRKMSPDESPYTSCDEKDIEIDGQLCTIDNRGVIRDKFTRQLVKGSKPITPGGRPRRVTGFIKMMSEKAGEDGVRIIKQLGGMAFYDVTKDYEDSLERYNKYKEENPDSKVKFRFSPRYQPQHILKALEMYCHYLYGRPVEQKKIEQHVDIKIKQQVQNLTKLISENKDKLKVIQGGFKDEREIEEGEVIDIIEDKQ